MRCNEFWAHFRPTMIAFILSALGLVACSRKELSEPPPAGSSPPPPSTAESIVGIHVSLPFAALQTRANETAPSHFDASGRVDPKPCVKVGPVGDLPFGGHFDLRTNVCSDVDYAFSADRAGPVSIGPSSVPNAFRIQVPINFSGHAGFSGDIARVVGLNRKNFEGGLNVWADISAAMGSDWCPALMVQPGFDWRNNARIQVAGTPAIWIDVSGQVNGPLNSRLAALGEAVKGVMTCGVLKDTVAKHWMTQAFPLALPDMGGAFVNVDPVGAEFSGLSVTSDKIEFGLRVRVKADVSTVPIASTTKPMPPLGQVPAAASGALALSVPLRAKYEPLEEALMHAVGGREFSTDTPAGKVSATIGGITIYPSNGKLAVGIAFSAKLPGRWLGARGIVYLVGTPTAANKGHTIEIHDLKFTRILDNELWTVLTELFENQIIGELNKNTTVDLTAPIAQAKKALQDALDRIRISSKIDIALTNVDMGIANIAPANGELVVTTQFRAAVDATLLANN